MACPLYLLGFCGVLIAQTGTVEGDVTDCVTHKPLAGARVKLRAGERVIFGRCDANGRFQLPEVPVGSYSVQADQPGYSGAAQPFRHATPSPGAPGAEVHVSLLPYGVISGRVTDSAGVPIEGVRVELMNLRPINPNQRALPGMASRRIVLGDRELMTGVGVTTNDLGEYRFPGGAGTYYLRVHPLTNRDGSDETERLTYYPNALRAALGRPVALAAGRQVPNIDIRLIRQAGVRISGTVVQPASSSKGRWFQVSTSVLAWRQDAPDTDEPMLAVSTEYDAFDLKNFLPGQYVIEALEHDRSDPEHPRTLMAGRRTVEVRDKDLDGVEIPLLPAVDIPGTVVFGESCPAVRVSVVLRADSRMANFAPQDATAATRTFTLTGLVPGKYALTITPQPTGAATANGYSVVSATLGDREVLRTGFEVTGQPAGAMRISIACGVQPSAREVVR